jgi:hypothetical protein
MFYDYGKGAKGADLRLFRQMGSLPRGKFLRFASL